MNNELKIINLKDNESIMEIINSLKEYGFAVIIGHGIEKEKIDKNFECWKIFFNSEEKYQYAYDGKVYGGYFSEQNVEIPIGHTKRDNKEFAHFYQPDYPSVVKETHSQIFIELTSVFYKILDKLEEELPEEVRKLFYMSLVDTVKDSPLTSLRVNHYPPIKNDGRVRAAAHTDVSFMTLLMTDEQKGLEVLTKEGEWIPIPTEYNSIVINIGDQIEEYTKGYFKSTYHRVVNIEEGYDKSRYSIPLFVHMHPNVKVTEDLTTDQFLLSKCSKFGFKHVKDSE